MARVRQGPKAVAAAKPQALCPSVDWLIRLDLLDILESFPLCCFVLPPWHKLTLPHTLLFNQKSLNLHFAPYRLSKHILFHMFIFFFLHLSSPFLHFPMALPTHPRVRADQGQEGRKANHRQRRQQFVEHLLCARRSTTC